MGEFERRSWSAELQDDRPAELVTPSEFGAQLSRCSPGDLTPAGRTPCSALPCSTERAEQEAIRSTLQKRYMKE